MAVNQAEEDQLSRAKAMADRATANVTDDEIKAVLERSKKAPKKPTKGAQKKS